MTRLPRAGLLLLGAALAGCPDGADDTWRRASAGPLVGAVSSSTARLWLYPGQPVEGAPSLGLRVRPHGGDAWRDVSLEPAGGGAWRATVAGLEPGGSYDYAFSQGDAAPEGWAGTLRTTPAAPTHLRLALGSCFHVGKDPTQRAWVPLLEAEPDLLLLLGDNVYANSTDPDRLWRAHLQQRRVPNFAAVVRRVPTLAIWDDHDFGPNDAAGDEPGKEHALRVFGEVFVNPAGGTEDVPGVFFRDRWGDAELFALDVRYHRSPHDAPDGPGKVVLGEAQRAWLREALAASTARFKLIASGSAFVREDGKRDTWASYPDARRAFYDLLAEVGGGGVLLLTGDLHRSALEVHPPAETGLAYPLYEVVASGLAHSEEESFVILDLHTAEPAHVEVRVIHGDGAVVVQQTVTRAELE